MSSRSPMRLYAFKVKTTHGGVESVRTIVVEAENLASAKAEVARWFDDASLILHASEQITHDMVQNRLKSREVSDVESENR